MERHEEVREIEVAKITTAGRHRWRSDPNDDHVEELAESFATVGQINPIVVRPGTDGNGFILVEGEHRLRAAIENGQKTILARIVEVDEDRARLMSAAESLVRLDFTDEEMDRALLRYKEDFERVHGKAPSQGGRPPKTGAPRPRFLEEASRTLGMSETSIKRRLGRLKKLVPAARESLAGGRLTADQANELIKCCRRAKTTQLPPTETGAAIRRRSSRIARSCVPLSSSALSA